MIIEQSKQSSWLVPFFSLGGGLVTLLITWKLGRRFPTLTIVEYGEEIYGKILGKILSGGYILFFFVFNVLIIREFTDFLRTSILPNTPVWFLSLTLILVGSYGVLSGIEVLARSAEFVLPLFCFSFLIISFAALPEIDLEELLPLFEEGLIPVMKASITLASWFGEIIILAFLFPLINKPGEALRKGSLALLVAAGILIIDILFTLTILGSDLSRSYALPVWQVIRFLEIRRSFLRLETLFIFLWVSVAVIKFSIIYFLSCLTTAQVFGLKSYRRIVIPMGVILVGTASFLVGSTIEFNEILNIFWPPFALFFEIVLPLFFLITATLKKEPERKLS